MSFRVETTRRFDREFKKLDRYTQKMIKAWVVKNLVGCENPSRYTQKMIKAWVVKNLVGCENPRLRGKALAADRSGQWRYRIGDYRLICQIEDERLVILALSVGHRREIYNKLT